MARIRDIPSDGPGCRSRSRFPPTPACTRRFASMSSPSSYSSIAASALVLQPVRPRRVRRLRVALVPRLGEVPQVLPGVVEVQDHLVQPSQVLPQQILQPRPPSQMAIHRRAPSIPTCRPCRAAARPPPPGPPDWPRTAPARPSAARPVRPTAAALRLSGYDYPHRDHLPFSLLPARSLLRDPRHIDRHVCAGHPLCILVPVPWPGLVEGDLRLDRRGPNRRRSPRWSAVRSIPPGDPAHLAQDHLCRAVEVV